MAKTLQITQMLVPSSKYGIKCPYSMNPTSITRHDTANDASAMAEVSYMIGNNNEVSYHYAVDDYRVVQGIDDNRNSWSVGDGSSAGSGNRNTISVETCYSLSGGERYEKAADNTLTLFAMLMKKHGIPVNKIYYHKDWNGKNCPHRLMSQGIMQAEFRKQVQARYDEMYNGGSVTVDPLPDTGTNYKVGDVVTINGVYTSSGSDNKLKPAKTTGTITKIIKGARNPYLLDNGNIGWVNDGCIVSGGSSTGKSVTELAQEVLAGKWGNNPGRKQKLEAAGYDYDAIQAEVNRLAGGGSSTPSKSVTQVAQEVLAGKWGNNPERKQKLQAAGYDYNAVQAEVNRLAGGGSSSSSKSVTQVAQEVLAGKWGNNPSRKQKLEAAGYDYDTIQAEVNRLAGGGSSSKSVTQVAKEVLAGKWGNNPERKQKLEAAGYDYDAVQAEVNRLV